jgi:hypothetical protein
MAERSLLAVAIAQAGVWKGTRAVEFMVAWQTARESLNDEWPEHDGVTAQLYAYRDWWRQAQRTAWRDLERFRAAFPGESTPSHLVDVALAAKSWDRQRGVQGLGAAVVAGV